MQRTLTRDHRFLLIILFVCVLLAYANRSLIFPLHVDDIGLQQELYFKDSSLILLPADSTLVPVLSAGELTRQGIALFYYSPLCVNNADQEMLMTLPGIGPSMAERIIRFREKNGPIMSKEEFMKIKGIGPKTFDRLQHLITFT